jgi:small subunit ribosomal protein S21
MDLAHDRRAYRHGRVNHRRNFESQVSCRSSSATTTSTRLFAFWKKKLQREGVYREMKLRRHFEKPSEKRAREHAAAVSRARKADRKRAEKDQ